MRKSFHNTINESGQTLLEFERNAKGQEMFILDFFKENPYPKMFTPFQIHSAIHELKGSPITSIRRAMTNLAKERTVSVDGTKHIIPAYIHKSDVRVIEKYGVKNYKWYFQN